MKIYAGPCLLNNRQEEIDDIYKTAEALAGIDKDIRFRCKLWGGGTTPEKYKYGIGMAGLGLFSRIKESYGLKSGTEIKDSVFLGVDEKEYGQKEGKKILPVDFIWIAARSSQNYELLAITGDYVGMTGNEVLIKRHPGMTVDEIIGIHDICEKIHGYKPMLVERGINTFCRTDKQRWVPDYQGMLRILQERPDIELCFDASHSCGVKSHIFPMVKAAYALGVRNFMLECMNDPGLSQTDQAQILSIDEFKEIYNFLKSRIN